MYQTQFANLYKPILLVQPVYDHTDQLGLNNYYINI